MLDPFIVTTVIAGVAAIGMGCERIILKARLAANEHRIADLLHTRAFVTAERDALRAKEANRIQHLRSISPKGNQASRESAQAKRANTLAALPNIALRPREDVVAGVADKIESRRQARAA